MAYRGLGTQAVVDEVSRRFPGATVLRWDSDAARRPEEYERLLTRFRSGEAQVLVGTQMIAKGLHFPSVTVVGVVLADVGLNIPDYRAGERAFQLLFQVAGRAGRGPQKGVVVIQTYQPDNYAVRAAAAQDYRRFYAQEAAYRKEQGNPPFSELIKMLYTHANRAMCEREAMRVSEALRRERDSRGYSDVEVLGPTPAYPARLRGRYRWQLILRGAKPRALLGRLAGSPGWVVDVDPVGMG
jgi:primosomal protein N' (replication factor Y)